MMKLSSLLSLNGSQPDKWTWNKRWTGLLRISKMNTRLDKSNSKKRDGILPLMKNRIRSTKCGMLKTVCGTRWTISKKECTLLILMTKWRKSRQTLTRCKQQSTSQPWLLLKLKRRLMISGKLKTREKRMSGSIKPLLTVNRNTTICKSKSRNPRNWLPVGKKNKRALLTRVSLSKTRETLRWKQPTCNMPRIDPLNSSKHMMIWWQKKLFVMRKRNSLTRLMLWTLNSKNSILRSTHTTGTWILSGNNMKEPPVKLKETKSRRRLQPCKQRLTRWLKLKERWGQRLKISTRIDKERKMRQMPPEKLKKEHRISKMPKQLSRRTKIF